MLGSGGSGGSGAAVGVTVGVTVGVGVPVPVGDAVAVSVGVLVLAGEAVELTVTEFNILAALAQADGNTLTRDQIFQVVWGEDHHGTRRTIDNFVAQLRGKLEDDPGAPSHLLTVRGVGYRLVS